MLNIRYFLFLFLITFFVTSDFYFSFSLSLFLSILIRFLILSNNNFVFREFVLLLYALNYLLSPSISFLLVEKVTIYNLKLSQEAYFNLALPGFLLFYAGLFSIKTSLFSPNFSAINISTITNEKLLKKVIIFAILF
jgi:hypothetical protein